MTTDDAARAARGDKADVAGTGQEALDQTALRDPAAVILDLARPEVGA